MRSHCLLEYYKAKMMVVKRSRLLLYKTRCIAIQIRRISAGSSRYIINSNLNEQYNIESTMAMNTKFISHTGQQINKKVDASTQNVLYKLNNCTDIKSVLNTIYQNNATHISVYAKALQMCHKLTVLSSNNDNNVKYIEMIFKMIENENVLFNIYFFNILFNVLSKTKIKSGHLLFYFQKLYGLKDTIKPDEITLSTLIKCCRKCDDIKLAEKILFLLKDIKLSKYALNELVGIYGNNKQIDKAETYFNKLCLLESTPNIITYGSMLNAYAQIGDIRNIKLLINKMSSDNYLKQQLKKSGVIYTALMKGYSNCTPSKPKKMLSVFDIMVHNTDCKILDVHINFKASAYNKLIMDGINTEKYLDKLLNELPKEREMYVSGVNKYNQILASLQLKGLILAHKNDFDLIVPVFEQKLQQYIGYWRRIYDQKTKSEKYVLEFYGFTEIITRFILKYIFKYQKQQLLDAMDENGSIEIFCDDALPNKYKSTDSDLKFQENSELKYVIKDEIISWNKAMNVDTDFNDTHKLILTLNAKYLVE
eukprot:272144_1